MRRRGFITFLGGAVVAFPFAARAQTPDRIPRIGVLVSFFESDPEGQARIAAFQEGLQKHGWVVDGNVRIDFRWGAGQIDRIHKNAEELVALAPDVILAIGSVATGALQHATLTIPIVMAQVTDPVGLGFVASLAHPGGNITGFARYEFTIGGKWLEVLKEVAPRVIQVAVIYNPDENQSSGYLRAIEAAAQLYSMQLIPAGVRDGAQIDHAIDAMARASNGGLLVIPGPTAVFYRERIVTLAARYRLPAVYPYRYFAKSGGLISYANDNIDLLRRAASYVDRILRGEKPSNLPVQDADKFELIINLQTAKALGLTVPPTLLARADEVIE